MAINGVARVGIRGYISPTATFSYLLDTSYVTNNTVGGAWGFRKLVSAYSGNAVTVRRSYDNAELDIPFLASGFINEALLQNFISEGVRLAGNDVINWGTASMTSDSDAVSFISAANITNSTQQVAINKLVSSLKYEGIWTKMKAIYPFVGGTASSHKFNLKDPRDIDAAYRLTFSGGWTHNSLGALPNGTNAYADTKLIPSTVLAANNAAVGVYLQNNTSYTSNGVDLITLKTDIGCSGTSANTGSIGNGRLGIGAYVGSSFAGTNARICAGVSGFVHADSVCVTDSRGMTIVNRGSTASINILKSDQLSVIPVQYNSVSDNVALLSSINIFLGANYYRNTTGTTAVAGYSDRQQSFAFVSDGLTNLESLKLSRIIEIFQKDLGRNVTPNEFAYSPGNAYVKVWYDQSGNGLDLKMMTQHAQPVIARNGVLVKDNNRISFDLNGLYSGLIGGLFTASSTNQLTSIHVVGSKLGQGTWSGNNLADYGYVMNFCPPVKFTANVQASNYYLPTKFGIFGYTPDLGNFNTNPSLYIAPSSALGGYGLSSTDIPVGTTQSIINYYFDGSLSRISKDNVESTLSTGYNSGYVTSGYIAIGWVSTVNPYNYYSNIRLAEIVMQKSTLSGNYFGSTDASIINKSQLLKNQADYFNTVSIPTVSDADAQIFTTQAKLNTTEANAVNTLVKGLKTAGVWTKLVAIMPFMGSTKYTQAFNLKSPYWSKRGSFGTTAVSTASGFQSDGTLNGVINVGIGLNSTFTYNNIHMSAYIDNIISNGHSMGASSGTQTFLGLYTTSKQFQLSGTSTISIANTNTSGYYIGNSLSTSTKIFENGNIIKSGTPVSTALNTTTNAYIGGSGDSNQNARFKFATYGYGLTDAEAVSLSTLVNAFLTSIGRI